LDPNDLVAERIFDTLMVRCRPFKLNDTGY
jgi:hypothetical protein